MPVRSLEAREAKTTVYNLSVEEHSNYAVGEAGVLVHNSDRCCISNKNPIPGVERPFRGANSSHPPDAAATQWMDDFSDDVAEYGCDEIAEDLLKATDGRGQVLRATPAKPGELRVMERGEVVNYYYHEVFTDGRYVFDPRLSDLPIPLGDWRRQVRRMNPGVRIERVDD